MEGADDQGAPADETQDPESPAAFESEAAAAENEDVDEEEVEKKKVAAEAETLKRKLVSCSHGLPPLPPLPAAAAAAAQLLPY